MNNTKTKMDVALDRNAPSSVVTFTAYYNGIKDIMSRGGKIRCITDVTPENIGYCKILLGLVSELRHLDGLKGGVAINESEYLATNFFQHAQPLSEVIYSSAKEVVAQGQYIFDTLWKNAIPAVKRIQEIEDGIEPIKTEVIEGAEEIGKKLHQITEESNYLHICSTPKGMALGRDHYFGIENNTNKKFADGSVKWVTSINNQKEIEVVKFFLKDGIKVKHISNIPSINFVISDKYFASTTEKVSGTKTISNFLVSNDPVYIDHFSTIFDNTWKSSVDAVDRIRELGEAKLFKTKMISNPEESLDILNHAYTSARNEILILLPSRNALSRLRNTKDLEKLNELGMKSIIVKILIISSRQINQIKKIRQKYPKIEFRVLEFNFPILNRITIIDTFKTIIIKIKDDSITITKNAMDVTTFIEGGYTALSYKSIFDTLWEQTLTYEKLKKVNKELQSHGKLQKEFIDILAHEIRSPIQPIIGLTKYVKNTLKDKEQIELLDSVIASGQKLNTLTKNILEISRIEDNVFTIRKRKFDLNEAISNTIKTFERTLRESKSKISFEFTDSRNVHYINGDKTRIEQVVSNLIHNSIKSIKRSRKKSEGGMISIFIKSKNKNKNGNLHELQKIDEMVEIIVEDNGEGIDPKVKPYLFTKFTKSLDGNGLGLYVCKKIVELHGGKITLAKGKKIGARFIITLPSSHI